MLVSCACIYSPQIVNHRLVVRHTEYRKMLHIHQFGSPVVQRLRHSRCACTQSEIHWWNCLPSVGSPLAALSRLHFVRLMNLPMQRASMMLFLSLQPSQTISIAFFFFAAAISGSQLIQIAFTDYDFIVVCFTVNILICKCRCDRHLKMIIILYFMQYKWFQLNKSKSNVIISVL